MFRTQFFIIIRLLLYTHRTVSMECLAARHSIDAWQNTVCYVYRSDFLMMINYLFETCRGQFN